MSGKKSWRCDMKKKKTIVTSVRSILSMAAPCSDFYWFKRLLKANKLSYIIIVGHWSKECPRLMFSDRSGSSFRDRYSRDPYPPPPPPPPFLHDRFRVNLIYSRITFFVNYYSHIMLFFLSLKMRNDIQFYFARRFKLNSRCFCFSIV